jgi:hypothetical protein
MLEYLERLRFLRRAVTEGLISDAEYEQHRQKLLRAAWMAVPMPAAVNGVHDAIGAMAREEVSGASDAKRVWQVLIAALVEVLEAYAARVGRQGKPSAKGEEPAAKASTNEVHPRPLVGADDRGGRSRFAFNKRGLHHNSRHKLPRVDPLEFNLDQLWQETPLPAPPERTPSVDPCMHREREENARGCRAGCTAGRPDVQRVAINPTPRARYAGAPTGLRAFRRPTTTTGAPVRPPARERAAQKRPPWRPVRPVPPGKCAPPPKFASPTRVRRAAMYVARAAGLKHGDERPRARVSAGDHEESSHENQHAEPRGVRFTLQANIVM